jgi:hypothetical protein
MGMNLHDGKDGRVSQGWETVVETSGVMNRKGSLDDRWR